jgi:hypothetical protein
LRFIIRLFLFLCCIEVNAQFAPQAGEPGSDAISADDTRFVGWTTSCTVHRGYVKIDETALGRVDFGDERNALGKADGLQVVSLGDSGYATCTFNKPIRNGIGPDFAVFENGFLPGFLELAFVEVSSDGVHFVRFPAVSLTPTDLQIGAFDLLQAAHIHNLAGKFVAGYGVPFDLDELKDAPGLDIELITHVRVVDAVGSVSPKWGSKDANGNMVNDPWPTPFPSGGFDLDAVGVLHFAETESFVYPTVLNASMMLNITNSDNFFSGKLYTASGKELYKFSPKPKNKLPTLKAGIYILQLYGDNKKYMVRLLVQ